MKQVFKIGTRESELALWQATLVKNMLADHGYPSELVTVKSEGDMDQITPLYEMGVQGVFTRSLDSALLGRHVDIAVHSMKDVPTQLPQGIFQAAVLKRGNHKDLFIPNENFISGEESFYKSLSAANDMDIDPVIDTNYTIATSSIRRKAQWLHRYHGHQVVNLRGNINTRMQKIAESNWHGAILAAAGLERIGLKPSNAIELDWMLPAPAQGAIVAVCRSDDGYAQESLKHLNDEHSELCTRIEKDFLRALMGGCSTPISALAVVDKKDIFFKGSVLTTDGKQKEEIEK